MNMLSYAKFVIYGLLLFVVWDLIRSIEQIELESPLEIIVITIFAFVLAYPQKRSNDK